MNKQLPGSSLPGEIWKEVKLDIEATNHNIIEVSNFGRIRTTNRLSDKKIRSGTRYHGYITVNFKFYKPRSEEIARQLEYLKGQIGKLQKDISMLKLQLKQAEKKNLPKTKLLVDLVDNEELMKVMQKNYREKFRKDELRRTINVSMLVHRVVGEYFCEKPDENHNIVIHLDHDKTNNRYSNLKWVTQEECTAHQQHNPTVIAAKEKYSKIRPAQSKAYKLTETNVMLIKKKLGQGVPKKTIAKQFKVTVTQLTRIERGENWGDVPAAL